MRTMNKFILDYNLDSIRVWARQVQLEKSWRKAPDYLGPGQFYWEDQVPENFWRYLNELIPLMSMYKGQGPRYCTLQEYQKAGKLVPHCDDFIELFETSLIIPLIGRFKTSTLVGENDHTPIETMEYGPGDAFYLKSREYWHKGEPLDGYRLNLMCFIEKGTDLNKYLDNQRHL